MEALVVQDVGSSYTDRATKLVRALIERAESKTSVRDAVDRPVRTTPSTEDIQRAWGQVLVHLGKFDSIREMADPELFGGPICWACGLVRPQLEKAHILARCEGGSDKPTNFHLLCWVCHLSSEYLWGRTYWEWFMAPWSAPQTWKEARRIIGKHPELFSHLPGLDELVEKAIRDLTVEFRARLEAPFQLPIHSSLFCS